MLKNITCLPDLICPDLADCTDGPLASSLHSFKSEALGEAYSDLDLTAKGIALLEDIPALKDALLSSKIKRVKGVKRIASNKSGHYYLRKLTRKERKQYLKNFKTISDLIPLTVWLDGGCADSLEFIGCAFNWQDSPEGIVYWNLIADKMRYIENLQNL